MPSAAIARIVLPSILLLLLFSLTPSQALSMTWKATWQDILNGGPRRWKVDDITAKQIALSHILEHSVAPSGTTPSNLRILCPLAGDDTFVHYAWSQGHEVTAIDIVPEALEAMRLQFGAHEDWTSSLTDEGTLWKHKSGRASLYEGDMMMKRNSLLNYFHAVYDKDSFGALTLDLRSKYCERLSDYVKDNGTLYVEVKNKTTGRDEQGPPFHVEKQDLMEPSSFGKCFEHVVSLGEVYKLDRPTAIQTGHVLRRLTRK
eukprot:CCRYP_005133-RA/>CCRYP_005133-RA protein AED:0.44 eAED:0.42 QI:0/-1/0/1/-1/1/1/0/258